MEMKPVVAKNKKAYLLKIESLLKENPGISLQETALKMNITVRAAKLYHDEIRSSLSSQKHSPGRVDK